MYAIVTQCHWPEMAIIALDPDEDSNRLFYTRKEAEEWAEENANFPYIIIDLETAKTPGYD